MICGYSSCEPILTDNSTGIPQIGNIHNLLFARGYIDKAACRASLAGPNHFKLLINFFENMLKILEYFVFPRCVLLFEEIGSYLCTVLDYLGTTMSVEDGEESASIISEIIDGKVC